MAISQTSHIDAHSRARERFLAKLPVHFGRLDWNASELRAFQTGQLRELLQTAVAHSCGAYLPHGPAGDSLLVMASETREQPGPEVRGVAGYESPYPYLDRLQEKMEERLAHRVPAKGRFCGYCYARLRADDAACGFCGTDTLDRPTVNEIPQDVLRLYKQKANTEAKWVHTGAFVGMILASFIFIWMVIWGPGILGHPALAFAVLLLGGYFLAQLFGPILFAQTGYRRGAKNRDEGWARWLKQRDDIDGPC